MKKITKIIPLTLVGLALAACSGSSTLKEKNKVIEFANENYSSAEVLNAYQSVKVKAVKTEITASAKEVKNDDAATAKNAEVLEDLKDRHVLLTDYEVTTVINEGNIDSYMLNEGVINDFYAEYSNDKSAPEFVKKGKKGLSGASSFSSAMSEDELTLLESNQGGVATETYIECNNLGMLVNHHITIAYAVDVDGDKDHNVDVQYTLHYEVTYEWVAK